VRQPHKPEADEAAMDSPPNVTNQPADRFGIMVTTAKQFYRVPLAAITTQEGTTIVRILY
jgi:hypothetical protein